MESQRLTVVDMNGRDATTQDFNTTDTSYT